MYQDRIILTMKDILEKEFKVDTRGYRPQEVDKFLDIIIKDYDEYNTIVKSLQSEKRQLVDENMRLKQEIRSLRTKLEAIEEAPVSSGVNNADLLRRLSKLETYVYGSADKE